MIGQLVEKRVLRSQDKRENELDTEESGDAGESNQGQ